MTAPVALAFGAGLLATVNPCGIALLPSFLSLYLGSADVGPAERSPVARAAQGFVVGAVLSAAFAAVFVAAGLVVAAGLRSFVEVVPWVAAVVGAILLVLGVAMVAGRRVALVSASRVSVGSGGEQGYRRVAVFGMTYAFASLSCTLGVFLAVVGQSLAAADPLGFVAVFGAYAAGSATVLIALSVSAALAKGALARGLGRLAPAMNRVAGALLATSGAYLILYWLPTLRGGALPDSPLARFSANLSSDLSEFFSRHTAAFAVALVVLVAAGTAALVVRDRRRAAEADGAGREGAEPSDREPLADARAQGEAVCELAVTARVRR